MALPLGGTLHSHHAVSHLEETLLHTMPNLLEWDTLRPVCALPICPLWVSAAA